MLGQFGNLLRAIADGPDPASLPSPGEVIATLEVGAAPPDYDYSKEVYRYSGYVAEAALAANRSTASLYCPAECGVVAVVHRMIMKSDHNDIVITLGNDVLDDDGAENACDVRLRLETYVNRMPSCEVRSKRGPFPGVSCGHIFPSATDGTDFFFEHTEPYIIFPGSTLMAVTSTDEKKMACTFWWTERRFDLKELVGVRQGLFT